MSLNLNHIVLAGHLTRDPELRQIGSERVVANTGIAINRRWKNAAGEQQEEATFVDIEAWGRTAELMGQYLKKGSPIYVEGRLKLDQWEDKEGQKRTRLKVVAENVQFLGGRQQGAPAGDGGTEAAPASGASAGAARPATTGRGRPAPSRVPASEEEAPF